MGDIGTGRMHRNYFFSPKVTKEKSGTPKIAAWGAQDGSGEPGMFHRNHRSKKPLNDHKKQLWVFLFYFVFLNATSFSGIGLIVVIKVSRGTLSLQGMDWGEERRAMGADLSPFALRGKIIES